MHLIPVPLRREFACAFVPDAPAAVQFPVPQREIRARAGASTVTHPPPLFICFVGPAALIRRDHALGTARRRRGLLGVVGARTLRVGQRTPIAHAVPLRKGLDPGDPRVHLHSVDIFGGKFGTGKTAFGKYVEVYDERWDLGEFP